MSILGESRGKIGCYMSNHPNTFPILNGLVALSFGGSALLEYSQGEYTQAALLGIASSLFGIATYLNYTGKNSTKEPI